MYIFKVSWIIHAILRCSDSWDCNIDEYDRRNAWWLWNTKIHYCQNTEPSLPQSCIEVTAAAKFDYPISHISEHLSMLLKSAIALCLAPGGPGSIWKYLEALVRSTRVSGRFVCDFRTDLRFADEDHWTWAMEVECTSILFNNTFKTINSQEGRQLRGKPIGSKSV